MPYAQRECITCRRETNFAERIYIYLARLFNRFNAPVATFVIFTDEEENWWPAVCETELLGLEQAEELALALLDFSALDDLAPWLRHHPLVAETSGSIDALN